MTQIGANRRKAWLGSAAAIALLFGLEFPNPQLTGEPSPLPNDHTMIVAGTEAPSGEQQVQTDENANESVEAGTESGAQISDDADAN
jgi:hypothetical protein